ncbi:MAG: hypothetical protein JOZ15_11720 [Acidobacteria bacterium]|nr:hypothetical protein [Acidobacteriota bacterium]
MSRATCKHAVAVLALLATFSMTAPAPAQAASRAPGAKASASGGLTFLSSLWHHLAALLHGGDARPLDGVIINPDGG